MGCTIMNGAKVGSNCIIGACSLITQGKVIPDNSLVMGAPGKVVRELTEKDILSIEDFDKIDTSIQYGEDWLLSYYIFNNSKTIFYDRSISDYQYIQNYSSIVHTANVSKAFRMITIRDRFLPKNLTKKQIVLNSRCKFGLYLYSSVFLVKNGISSDDFCNFSKEVKKSYMSTKYKKFIKSKLLISFLLHLFLKEKYESLYSMLKKSTNKV